MWICVVQYVYYKFMLFRVCEPFVPLQISVTESVTINHVWQPTYTPHPHFPPSPNVSRCDRTRDEFISCTKLDAWLHLLSPLCPWIYDLWAVNRNIWCLCAHVLCEQETSGAFVPTCTTQIFQKIFKSWSRKNIFLWYIGRGFLLRERSEAKQKSPPIYHY